jgi:hypothetical protein
MPDHSATNESDEEDNVIEHGKYDAAYVRITTGNKTVFREGSSDSRHSYDPKYGSDVSYDDNESNDGESVNGDDEDNATAEATVTDKGDAEMRRATLLGATTALPTTAPGAAGGAILSDAGNMLDALLHGYADTPQPPVFALRANTTAAGNNATGNTVDLTNTADDNAARDTIDLTNNQLPTKKVRFDKTAARDAAIDLTNDKPEPKMKSSLPSGDNHGLTDDDLAFDDPFGLNEHEQTYAHADAVQDLDPNFQATNSMSTSSFGLQILLATPTGTLPTRGTNADIEHLNAILNGIHARPEMSMIHTKDVDSTALVPTCFVRFTSQPFQPLVTVGCDLYNHGSEVRRVLLQDGLTGQSYEVDLMLCDSKFCQNCGATADICPPISFNESAR